MTASEFYSLDNLGAWKTTDVEPILYPVVTVESNWFKRTIAVEVDARVIDRAWMSKAGVSLLEEVGTTLRREGAHLLKGPSRRGVKHWSFDLLRGRFAGWRNVSKGARHRLSGLAIEGSPLADTLEILSGSMPRYAQWLAKQVVVGSPRKILEVGAGTGTITRLLAEKSRVVAMEPSVDSRRLLQQSTHQIPNVQVVSSIEEAELLGPFDAIVLVNVLEHIDDDVGVLKVLRKSLSDNGYLAVFSPAHNILYSNFDASIGHVRRYSSSRLKKTFECAGYSHNDVRYFNALGAIAWLLINRVLKRKAVGESATQIYDNLLVPSFKIVDSLRIRPFGQSVVGIGHKY